ncbi:B3/4 domain-containing protein [Brevibacillus sp. TJ4]|uniref:B3/B4 domain-containing protein n=1 Tax=Brevibacillus sp. TJ4 TaxID=3234853 RepID=UPI0037D94F37
MTRFIIEEDFWSLFPHAKIGTVICQGIDNSIRDVEVYEKLLRDAEQEAHKFLLMEEFSSNPVISVWREAFQKFKTKKGARCSIEALLKRVKNGNPIGTINPLVDVYNSISLRYGLPCGGEDIDAFAGDIRLTLAKGDEPFLPLGSDENAPPYEGEVVYKDDAGAICRCWNWREAQRTMLTEQTKHAFLCIELIDETRSDEFYMALQELSDLVSRYLGGTVKSEVLDRTNREMTISG